MSAVTVRYFAGAAQAAGLTAATIDANTVGELEDALADQIGSVVLGQCTLLVDGRPNPPRQTPLADGSVMDVLPPFAGG